METSALKQAEVKFLGIITCRLQEVFANLLSQQSCAAKLANRCLFYKTVFFSPKLQRLCDVNFVLIETFG